MLLKSRLRSRMTINEDANPDRFGEALSRKLHLVQLLHLHRTRVIIVEDEGGSNHIVKELDRQSSGCWC